MAPWHAKLGRQNARYISTLHSLTPDGGIISCLNIEIVKVRSCSSSTIATNQVVVQVHPIAYIEFVTDKDGRVSHVGPRGEAEEAREAERWAVRREKEVAKLRAEHDRRLSRYRDYLTRLQQKAQKSAVHEDGEIRLGFCFWA